MAPDSWKQLYESTLTQARSGEIPAARLDDAVRRILRVKFRAGLFEAGKPSSRPLAGQFALLGAPEHRAVARRAVRESLVLLKNAKQVLPLKPRQRVLVAGDGADDIAKQSGGWTLSWQGTGTTRSQFPNAQSIYEGIREAVQAAGGVAELNKQGEYVTRPDVAIVVFGENPYAEFQGDLLDVEYSPGDKSDLALLKKLGGAGIPVVAVFLSGRPLWVNPEINASNAFVAAWLPGSEGGGVADVLFRKADGSVNHEFTGKLPFSWPRTPDQVGVNRGAGDRVHCLLTVMASLIRTPATLRCCPKMFRSGRPRALIRELSSPTARSAVDGDCSCRKAAVRASSPAARDAALTPAASRSWQRIAPRRKMRARRAGMARRAPFSASRARAPIDLQRETNGELSLAFDYRVTEPPTSEVLLFLECGLECKGSVPIAQALKSAPRGEWRAMKVLLSCFQSAGADMKKRQRAVRAWHRGPPGPEHHECSSGDGQGRRARLRTLSARIAIPALNSSHLARQISTYASENHRRCRQGGRRRNQDRLAGPERRAERQRRDSRTRARGGQGAELSPEPFSAQPRRQSVLSHRARLRESRARTTSWTCSTAPWRAAVKSGFSCSCINAVGAAKSWREKSPASSTRLAPTAWSSPPPLSESVDLIAALDQRALPFVRIAPNEKPHRTPYADMDDESAAREMTEYLISLGHRQIGFIKGHPEHFASGQRLRGFRAALLQHQDCPRTGLHQGGPV